MVFCVMVSRANGRKYENLLRFITSWLASLRKWYYFRLCFSFSCSGYDLISIKKSHTLNCYPFLQKFLLKTKIFKFVAGDCGSSIYCYNDICRKSYLLFITYIFCFFIVTFTLHLNVKNLQSPGNLNWYITWETKNELKI